MIIFSGLANLRRFRFGEVTELVRRFMTKITHSELATVDRFALTWSTRISKVTQTTNKSPTSSQQLNVD
jgi:hypothetical protein